MRNKVKITVKFEGKECSKFITPLKNATFEKYLDYEISGRNKTKYIASELDISEKASGEISLSKSAKCLIFEDKQNITHINTYQINKKIYSLDRKRKLKVWQFELYDYFVNLVRDGKMKQQYIPASCLAIATLDTLDYDRAIKLTNSILETNYKDVITSAFFLSKTFSTKISRLQILLRIFGAMFLFLKTKTTHF